MDADTRRLIEERLLTTQELAALLEVPSATVQQWASRHKVDWVLKGRTYLFDREDFKDFERPGNPGVPGRKSKDTINTNTIPLNQGAAEPASQPLL